MKTIPKVFVVVLNWNGKHTLLPCLRSVFASVYGNFEVVVVDNASKDSSLEAAKVSFSRAHFIVNEENVGFAAGMNVGMKFALAKGADYVWILNNDVLVGKESLNELVAAAEQNSDAILSPLILTPSGTSWFSAGKIDFVRMRAEHVRPMVSTQEKNPYETGYLTGCALFLPKAILEDVGFFDERFFLYYEDADLSLRAKKKGKRLLLVPKSVIRHAEQSEQAKGKLYWLVRSGLYFFDKHTPKYLRPWMSLYILLRKVKNAVDKRKGKEEAFLVSRAYEDYRSPKNS